MEEWPSPEWRYLGCPFSDEEKEDIRFIEQELLEQKRFRQKEGQQPSDSSSSHIPQASLSSPDTDQHDWIHTFRNLLSSTNIREESVHTTYEERGSAVPPTLSSVEEEEETTNAKAFSTVGGKGASVKSSSVDGKEYSIKSVSNENVTVWLSSSSSDSEEGGVETEKAKESISGINTNASRAVDKRFAPQPDTDKGFASQPDTDKGFASQPDTDKGFASQPDTHKGFASQPDTDKRFAPQPDTDKGFASQPDTDKGFAPQPDTDKGFAPQPVRDTEAATNKVTSTPTISHIVGESQRGKETQAAELVTKKNAVFEQIVATYFHQQSAYASSQENLNTRLKASDRVKEKNITPSEGRNSQVSSKPIKKFKSGASTRQSTKFGSDLGQSAATERRVTEPARRGDERGKTTKLIHIFVTDSSESSSSYSSSNSSGTSLSRTTVSRSIQHETVPGNQPERKPVLLPKTRHSFWDNPPRPKPIPRKPFSGASETVNPNQTNVHTSDSPASAVQSWDTMSSHGPTPGTSSGKPSGAKDRRVKQQEKRDKEKEKREKEKEKKEERREKEKEKREEKKKEREKREEERKERDDKESERKMKERREREDRERVLAGVVTQAPEPSDSEDPSSLAAHHGFLWRLFHTVAHLLFICLLLLTIGSLALGVSTLFTRSALEVAEHFQQGLTQSSYVELLMALVGFFFFMIILALTVLSAVMLVPALWVSLIEIIVCPWSVISDYFLP